MFHNKKYYHPLKYIDLIFKAEKFKNLNLDIWAAHKMLHKSLKSS